MTYAALGMKPQSDYNRNIYLDILDYTRQDKELESRFMALEEETSMLNAWLALVVGGFVVLVCLFLVLARLSGGDPALSFAKGFAALFGGELAGLALGSVPALSGAALAFGSALAGVLALFAYLFLFTERDFRALSVAMAHTDSFERACADIALSCGLSRREADILPLALRGRTGERMAAELYISKSTVETHLRRIYAKCGVGNRQELIDFGERVQREGAVAKTVPTKGKGSGRARTEGPS